MSTESAYVPPEQMPPAVRKNIILRRKIWPRMNVRNENWMGIMVGETGSGKSWGAIRLAEAIDPDFTPAQVAFNVEEFMELAADKSYGPGSVIVLDEAGVAASNRKWYEDDNEVLDFLTQTWRHQNRGAIMTLPDLDLIDNHVRRRFHHYIEMISKDEEEMISKAKIKYIDTNHETGKMYKKYHRIKDDTGTVKKYKYIQFRPPSEELVEQYEARKEKYTTDLNQFLLEKVRTVVEEEENKQTPREVADEIVSDGCIDEYIGGRGAGKYLSRDLLRADFGLSKSESKTVKDLLVRELDLDVM